MYSNRSFIGNVIPLLSMEYTTTSQLPVLSCTRVSGASTRRNWRLLRHHSPRWNIWVYVPKLLVPGLPHYTWSIEITLPQPLSDGSWRPWEPDHYPMPNIADFTNSIGTARVYSKLDLLKGYFQVPVHPADVPKTAIITPFGSYVFHYSTFGLRNSGATFQRMMDSIFGDLPNVLVYIDDLLSSRITFRNMNIIYVKH